MFHLQTAEALCKNFSPNTEKHGDDSVNVGDISISVNIANDQLEQFDSYLRDAMFQAPKRSGEQPQLVGDNAYTALRFPRVKSYRWGDAYTGCELTIGAGLNLAEPLTFVDVDVKNGFVLTPLEGGSVTVEFSARVHLEDEAEAGRLCFLKGKPITLTFLPPTKTADDAQGDLLEAGDAAHDHLEQAAGAMEKAAA